MMSKRYLPGLVLGLLAAFAPGCVQESGDELGADEAATGTVASEIVSTGKTAGAVTDIPFYFGVPKTSLTTELTLENERKDYPWSTVWSPSRENPEIGLRMIVIPEKPPASAEQRKLMAAELGTAGVIQDGDVILSFRTGLADTLAYPHIQMGSTHAGLAFRDDTGNAHNLDQPLDGDYNVVKVIGGKKRFVSSFETKHYAGQPDSTDALHILRPRWGSARATKTTNLRAWINRLAETHEAIRAAGGLNFNSDYLNPLIAKPETSAAKIATEFGQIMTGKVKPRGDFDMFCSEMAFYLLTLANCTFDDINGAAVGGEAACTTGALPAGAQPFEPMLLLGDSNNKPGLAEGPLLNLLHGGGNRIPTALDLLFPKSESGASKLSSGHRAVAEATKPLMGGLQQYYAASLGVPGLPPVEALRANINGLTKNVKNYSPTAFLVESMIPDAGQRSVDYVATVVFGDGGTLAAAKSIAPPAGPVPQPFPGR
jgi:hypothetical protein